MKRSSNRLVLLVGLFLAVVAFVLIAVMFSNGGPNNSGGPAASKVTQAKVVIAAKDIPLGSRITADMVTTKDINAGDKPLDSFADVALVIGQTARQPVTAQQLITNAIVNGTGSPTSISVPPGYVAIAVQVDQVTGVGTLIKPGDRVDVVTGITGADKVPLVYYVRASAAPGASSSPGFNPPTLTYNSTTVKVIVEGLQVLGTLLPPAAQTTAAASGAPQGGTTLNGQQEIVFLAATPQQAEAIRYSQIDGSISLLLRSAADCQAADGTASPCPIIPTTGITLRRMVDDFGILPPQVVEVLMPTPYPSPMPVRVYPSPSPSPKASAAPSASTTP